jgi:hypothetical protein
MQKGELQSVGISEDGSTLISRDSKGSFRILKDGKPIKRPTQFQYRLSSGLSIDTSSIAVSRKGEVIVVAYDQGVFLLESKDDYSNPTSISNDNGNPKNFFSVAVSSDGKTIAGADENNKIWIFKLGGLDLGNHDLNQQILKSSSKSIVTFLVVNKVVNNKIIVPTCNNKDNCNLFVYPIKDSSIDGNSKFTLYNYPPLSGINSLTFSEDSEDSEDTNTLFSSGLTQETKSDISYIKAWDLDELSDSESGKKELLELACKRLKNHPRLKSNEYQEIKKNCSRKNNDNND